MVMQGISEVLKEAGSASAEDLPDYKPDPNRPLTVREVAVAKVTKEVKEIKQMMTDAREAHKAAQAQSEVDDFLVKTKALHALSTATVTTPVESFDSTNNSTQP